MDEQEIIQHIQKAVSTNNLEMSLHAVDEAHAEEIHPNEIKDALKNCQLC